MNEFIPTISLKTILTLIWVAVPVFCVQVWQLDEFSKSGIYCAARNTLWLIGLIVAVVILTNWLLMLAVLATGVPHLGWGSTRSLKSYIAARRRKLKRLPENRRPLAHAQTWYWLGRALAELGQRVPDASTWRESGEALRKSLSGFRQAGKDRDWAVAQVHLAGTLEEVSRYEASKTPLVDAVEALHAAEKIFGKWSTWADWRDVQAELCAGLTQLGRLEDGTARLAEAVAAGKAALAEDNSQEPLINAGIKLHLSEALALLGEREPGTARLEEAVAMARESLSVIVKSKDNIPDKDQVIEWRALRLRGLGQALRCLGERRNDAELLREAVVTLQSTTALKTDQNARDWAVSQDELARALLALSQRVAEPDLPSDSLSASDAALGVLTRETYPFDWAVATTTRASTLTALATRAPDAAALRRAIDDLEAALEVFEQADTPVQRRRCRDDLDRATALLDDLARGGSGGRAEKSPPPGPMKPRPA